MVFESTVDGAAAEVTSIVVVQEEDDEDSCSPIPESSG